MDGVKHLFWLTLADLRQTPSGGIPLTIAAYFALLIAPPRRDIIGTTKAANQRLQKKQILDPESTATRPQHHGRLGGHQVCPPGGKGPKPSFSVQRLYPGFATPAALPDRGQFLAVQGVERMGHANRSRRFCRYGCSTSCPSTVVCPGSSVTVSDTFGLTEVCSWFSVTVSDTFGLTEVCSAMGQALSLVTFAPQ